MDLAPEAEAKIVEFLELLRSSGFVFDYRLHTTQAAAPAADDLPVPSASAPAAPLLSVEITGEDAALMTSRGGELLHALESMAASILRLAPEQHDQLSFDALGFKAQRREATTRLAEQGMDSVRQTARPFTFPPMNSRERRMLHLILAEKGFPTASSGDGPRRFVVVYPVGATPTPEQFAPPTPSRRSGPWTGGRGRSGPPFNKGRVGPSGRPPSPPQSRETRAPEPPRFDPNGNPLEEARPASAVALSEEQRLASLRKAFRKR